MSYDVMCCQLRHAMLCMAMSCHVTICKMDMDMGMRMDMDMDMRYVMEGLFMSRGLILCDQK